MRILIVEDEPELLADVERHLRDEGYSVDTSSDGNDGLYIASEYPLDAAIIDIGLPGMSGIDIILNRQDLLQHWLNGTHDLTTKNQSSL